MKNSIYLIIIIAVILMACNNQKSTVNQMSGDNGQIVSQTANSSQVTPTISETRNTGPVKDIVGSYLQLKNALARDNSSEAAAAGKKVDAAFASFDKTSLTAEQKKIFENVQADAKENAEHIGEKQREYCSSA